MHKTEKKSTGPCMECIIETSNSGAFKNSKPCTHNKNEKK